MMICADLIVGCSRVREMKPLVHCITNYVAMQFNADALLAVGASPIMSFCNEEMEQLSKASDALVVNIGCLDKVQVEAMKTAVKALSREGKPWILDPVGAGVSDIRTETCSMLMQLYPPAVIRGNASEILVLSGGKAAGRGVDSLASSVYAFDAARSLALRCGCIVSVSGETDIVTDGSRSEFIHGGDAMMSCVTAMGCTASALTGAFLAVCEDPFNAAVDAMKLMAAAGEAAAAVSKGNASMKVNFIDSLYNISRNTKDETAGIQC